MHTQVLRHLRHRRHARQVWGRATAPDPSLHDISRRLPASHLDFVLISSPYACRFGVVPPHQTRRPVERMHGNNPLARAMMIRDARRAAGLSTEGATTPWATRTTTMRDTATTTSRATITTPRAHHPKGHHGPGRRGYQDHHHPSPHYDPRAGSAGSLFRVRSTSEAGSAERLTLHTR